MIRAGEDTNRPEKRRQDAELDRVTIRVPAAAIHQVEAIIFQAQAKIIGPELDQRRELANSQNAEDKGSTSECR